MFSFLANILVAQTNLSGVWVASECDTDCPKIIEFSKNGRFVMFETAEDMEMNVKTVEGNYYYESDKDLLVIITWYDEEAKTSRYKFKVENSILTLNQIYPEKSRWKFKKTMILEEKNR